jgi:ribosomal protein S12 methylthiotransferase accessory factor
MANEGTGKLFRNGTHRVVAPAETVARARKLFGPVGITRVANVTGLDCVGIPVVMVCRPNARSLAVSQGKGVDLDAAKASGVMESIELYHAERVTRPLKLAAWNELRFSHDLVPVEKLPLLSVSVFHPDRPLLWIEGMDLLGSRPRWLPYELVHTNYTLPFPSGTGCFVMSSNGLASGNHPLEAVSHGLCEVIERDASALFRFLPAERQAAARIDLATVDHSDCRAVLDRYAGAGVAAGVWDMTSDVGVPAFRCVIVDEAPNPFRPLGPVEGMGCHPTREVALLRALTEAAQARLTLIAGSRDDNGRDRYSRAQETDFIDRARARLREKGLRRFGDVATHASDTFEDDLAWILGRLSSVGIEDVVVVDLTKTELGIPVVRVVVPGLETYHHVQGYVPGARARRVADQHRKEAAAQ